MVVVPGRDYAAVAAGTKREFRQPWVAITTHKALAELPIPIVGYTRGTNFGGARRSTILVCEAFWQEPLGAISQASIEAEGFQTVKEFRAYWRRRFRHGRFDRYQKVCCFRVRPYRRDVDEQHFKDVLYDRFILDPARAVDADLKS